MTKFDYQIHEPYSGWIDEFITTDEAKRLTGVPTATLITMRSRGGGPVFVNPIGTRLIRYQRRALFEWMFSRGVLTNTSMTPANDNGENA